MTDIAARSQRRRRAATRRSVGPAVLLGAAMVVLVVVPLAELGRAAFSDVSGSVGDIVSGPEVRRSALGTLWLALSVTGVTLIVAGTAAIAVERCSLRRRRWLRAGVLLPLLVPPFVSALSWAAAYGEGGLVDDVAGLILPGVYGPAGVALVITVNAVPLAYLIVAAGLATRADADLELAARASGAGPATVLRTVTLPAIRPSLVGAGALTFVIAINAFGIPAVLGTPAGFRTVTTQIYQDLAFSSSPAAFQRVLVLSLILVLATLGTVGLADVTAGARRRPIHRVETPSALPMVRLRRESVVTAAVGAYAVFATVLPMVALVLVASTRAAGLAPTPGNLTLSNFGEAWSAGTWDALRTSVGLAAAAATMVLVLAAVLVAVERRRRVTPLGTVAALTFAVPGSALAVAMILAYGSWLRDTLALILLAYVAKFWALGHRPVGAAITALSPDLVRAARVSGAGPFDAVRTVIVPLLRPALAVAWLLVFLFGLHELTMSSLLYGPKTATLAVVTLNLQQLGDPTVTAALAVLLTLIVTIAAVPLTFAWRSWTKVRTR